MAESNNTIDLGLGLTVGPISNLTLDGDAGDNRLIGTGGTDDLDGKDGNDQLFGFSGVDALVGGIGDDEIFAGGGDDSIEGGADDDRLTGGGGNDTIDGGAGIDTARYTGNASDYLLDLFTGTITDLRGIEGVDTLSDIEKLQFADGNVLLVQPGDSINDAIDAAGDGDTIFLAPGTYREQVSIIGRNNLTIQGEGAVIEAPDSLLAFNVASPEGGTRDVGSVVEVAFSSNITLTGFDVDGRGIGSSAVTASGAPTDFPTNFAGVLMLNSSGEVDSVDVSGARDPLVGGELGGGQTGDAIAVYNSDGEARSVTVRDSNLSDFQKTGGRFSGDGLTVLVSNNTVEGAGLLDDADDIAQNGFTIEQGATGRFEFNTISEIGNLRGDFASAGILGVDPGDNLRFFKNTLLGVSDGSGGYEDTSHTGILIRGSANNAGVFSNTFEGLLTGVAGIQDVDGKLFGGNVFTDMIPSFTPITGGGTRPGLNIAVSGIENERPVEIFATSDGPDLLQGSRFDDKVFTDLGRDAIFGGDGDDRLDGGGGNDTLEGENGDDVLVGRNGNDVINGGSGNDTLLGGGSRDKLFSQSGNDIANGGGGDDIVNGAAGDDELFGNEGDDIVNGGADSDRLDGGAGDDILSGQDGVDTFIFNAADAGSDRVIGFADGETVELVGFSFANLAAAEAAFSQVGTDVVFSAGGVTATFEGTNLAAVTNNIALDAGGASEVIERVPEMVVVEDLDWADFA